MWEQKCRKFWGACNFSPLKWFPALCNYVNIEAIKSAHAWGSLLSTAPRNHSVQTSILLYACPEIHKHGVRQYHIELFCIDSFEESLGLWVMAENCVNKKVRCFIFKNTLDPFKCSKTGMCVVTGAKMGGRQGAWMLAAHLLWSSLCVTLYLSDLRKQQC